MREITWETAMKIEAKLEELAEAKRELTAYQIAKDNLEIRLRYAAMNDGRNVQFPPQVY